MTEINVEQLLRDTIKDLETKIQFLVDYMESGGRLEDHYFTFADGCSWPSSVGRMRTRTVCRVITTAR